MSEVINRPASISAVSVAADPVCGMSVPADVPLRVEHAGKTYVFCAESCQQRFEENPSAFVGRNTEPPGVTRLKTR